MGYREPGDMYQWVHEICIDSSCERTKFECVDGEMTELLNSKAEMPTSSDATRLHTGLLFPKDS